jgi:division protein CdvB (Snf7/Vps24/ESCRT-III family)
LEEIIRKKEVIERLNNRKRELFEKTVELLIAREQERAVIYAKECAFVNWLIKQIGKE